MKRSPLKPKRATPRRRPAPRWSKGEWATNGQVLEMRAEFCCERCTDSSGPFERHHRKRRRDGGDRLCNLLYLCRDCHRWVTEHPAESRKAGWIVSVSRDPVDVPVLWRRTDWVMLDDLGFKFPAFHVTDAHD